MDSKDLPYEIRHSPELGRYLVASRDLPALELIIQERPLACAPADEATHEEIPMCLGCCARMSGNPSSTCSKCNWPVCSVECEQASHHAENECEILKNVEFNSLPEPTLLNETIFILRLCLIKSKNAKNWSELMKFEHHTKIRQSKQICVEKDRKVLANLGFIYKKDNLDESSSLFNCPFEEEDVIKISGVVNVNAFSSTKLEDECTTRRVRRRVTVSQCVFPTASLLAHSCTPNAFWTVSPSPSFEMTIRTTIPIPKGSQIAIAYAPREIFLATLQRLVSTEEIAHFICHCERCQDPTEKGTYIGAVKCSRCMQCCLISEDELSFLLPKSPTNPESDWECLRCGNLMCVAEVVKKLVKIEKEFEKIKRRCLSREEEADELEYLYKKAGDEFLHENHYLLQEISLRIVNRQASCIFNLEKEEVQRFLFHCKKILSVADVLSPGYCRHRAVIQFYMSQVMMFEARKKPKEGMGRGELRGIYMPIYELQKPAFTYFRCEDEIENRFRPGRMRGCSQYVACLMDEMKEALNFITDSL